MPAPAARPRAYALAIACLAAWAIPCAAKSPEAFVGSPPAPAHTGAGAAAPAPGKPSPRSLKPVLDTARIHAVYLDGDFDQAIHTLEGALQGKRSLTHADSVFAFKHLGVMYAATPATREKGRYYMLQLVSIEPTAKILDMYASDMIYLIFRNVQEEFESKYGKRASARSAPDSMPVAASAVPRDTAAPVPAPAAPIAAARPGPRKDRTWYWVAGGAAVAAGTAGLAFILLDDPQPKKRNIVLKE